LRRIPVSSRYGNASLRRWKLRIPQKAALVMIVTISNTLIVLYVWSGLMVRAVGRHSSRSMFDVENVGIIAFGCIFNVRRGRLLFE
jgi:hypothetical protein